MSTLFFHLQRLYSFLLTRFFIFTFLPIFTNATTCTTCTGHGHRANILVQFCSENSIGRHGKISPEERQAQFEQWKVYYKTTVGALHIWSWRTTPLFGCILLTLVSRIVMHLVDSVYLYSYMMYEPDIEESKRFTVFGWVSRRGLSQTLVFTVILLVVVCAAAMISVRYNRLRLLVATLQLPAFMYPLEDFSILQNKNAAMQIFDMPITVSTAKTIFQLLFIQTVLMALASTSRES